MEGYSEEVAKARAKRQGLDLEQVDLKKSKAWKKLKKEAEEEARHLLWRRRTYGEGSGSGSIFISEGFLKRPVRGGL